MSSKRLWIPRIIHQAWGLGDLRDTLPEDGARWRQEWPQVCPGWEHRCYGPDDISRLDPAMPPELLEMYYASPNVGHRADILRHWLVYSVGGVWADADMEPRRNFEAVLRGVKLFFAGIKPAYTDLGPQHLEICIMGGAPRHPFMAHLVQVLPQWCRDHWERSVSVRTGPQFVEWHLRRWLETGHEDDLTLFHPRAFCPFRWDEKDRAGEPFRTAYALHHWWGSWD